MPLTAFKTFFSVSPKFYNLCADIEDSPTQFYFVDYPSKRTYLWINILCCWRAYWLILGPFCNIFCLCFLPIEIRSMLKIERYTCLWKYLHYLIDNKLRILNQYLTKPKIFVKKLCWTNKTIEQSNINNIANCSDVYLKKKYSNIRCLIIKDL